MRIGLTGGTGFLGRFIAAELHAAGHEVVLLGRRAPAPGLLPPGLPLRPFELGRAPDLGGLDSLVHAAFDHLPGRYRGGEGDDPAGFLARNRDGSIALFESAAAAGLRRAVFLSSRAVYGAYPPGTGLGEALPPRPDTLYGSAKLAAEEALARLARPGFTGTNLRITGVYGPAGPGRPHKWVALFEAFRRCEPVAPRAGTEVHGADVAAAVRLCLEHETQALLNISDFVLDRRDLLAEVVRLTRWRSPLPPRATEPPSVMATDRIRALGWRPGGLARLRATLPALLANAR